MKLDVDKEIVWAAIIVISVILLAMIISLAALRSKELEIIKLNSETKKLEQINKQTALNISKLKRRHR